MAKSLKVKEHFELMVIIQIQFKISGLVIHGCFLANLDYDMATQRMCVQRGPSDSEDRCAHTVYNYKKVYMCFCQGDLCNTATGLVAPKSLHIIVSTALLAFFWRFIV